MATVGRRRRRVSKLGVLGTVSFPSLSPFRCLWSNKGSDKTVTITQLVYMDFSTTTILASLVYDSKVLFSTDVHAILVLNQQLYTRCSQNFSDN